MKKLRLSSKVVKGNRITLEADASARREAIYDLLEEVGKSVWLRTYNVTLAELAALVAMKPNEKPKSVTVRITYPNFCSLKYDDVDLRLRQDASGFWHSTQRADGKYGIGRNGDC